MTNTARTAGLLLGLAVVATTRAHPAGDGPKPLPADVLAAWKKAGASLGWMARDREQIDYRFRRGVLGQKPYRIPDQDLVGYRFHDGTGPGKPGELPAFSWWRVPDNEVLAKLPAP